MTGRRGAHSLTEAECLRIMPLQAARGAARGGHRATSAAGGQSKWRRRRGRLLTALYGVFLIAALVVVSGVIAYVGDIVGRRMGRKRLSLFGMRPRHTAIAVSVAAGMTITILTLTAAMAVSKDVRDGFLRMGEMRREQTRLSRKVEELTRTAADLDRERAKAESQVKASRAELAIAEEALKETRQEVESQQAKLKRTTHKLNSTSAALKDAEQQIKRAQRILANEYRMREELESDVERATRTIAVGRALPVVFTAGQVLDVDLLQGGRPVADIRADLESILDRLDRTVRAVGAKPLEGGKRAVVVQHAVVDKEKRSVTYFSEGQVLSAVAQQIHAARGGVIVRVDAVFNSHPGEPAYVDFRLFNNKKVYHRGQVLAETIVDGRLSEASIYVALVSLLRDEVSPRARRENIMPRPAPLGVESVSTVREPVGNISPEDLFASIAQLRAIKGPARVRVVAEDDIWTIGPLRVKFEISPVAPGSAASPSRSG